MATRYEIHPAIGIARLGDSEADYFIAPEPAVSEKAYAEQAQLVTNVARTPPPVRYRDDEGRLLRQAVRFRVFEVTRDTAGVIQSAKEAVSDSTTKIEIKWKVHLANRKAAAMRFADRPTQPKPPQLPQRRNQDHANVEDLIVDGRLQDISETAAPGKTIGGSFLGNEVKLGNAWVKDGRLYLLGGHGKTVYQGADNTLDDGDFFADNDGWCDDTSDGPVFADVIVNGAAAVAATPAWAVVAPFDFAPEIGHFLTLYEVACQAALENNLPQVDHTEFLRDVLPILMRIRRYRWVSGPVIRAETQDRHTRWTTREGLADLGNPSSANGIRWRKQLFAHLMPPDGVSVREVYMPRLYGHEPYTGDGDVAEANHVLPLLNYQYEHLRNWQNNAFTVGSSDRSEYLCEALDRIALDVCPGGPFHPGMEVGRIFSDARIYEPAQIARLRVKQNGSPLDARLPDDPQFDGLVAGQLTEGLGVPWQNDFYLCQQERGNGWWPASRPDDVFHPHYPPAVIIDSQSDWTVRWDDNIANGNEMVRYWMGLGIVRRIEALPKPGSTNSEMEERIYDSEVDGNGVKHFYYYGETERTVSDSMDRFSHFPSNDPNA